MNRQEIAELIRRVRAGLPASASPSSQAVSVPHVLVGLADAWPGPLTREHRQQIDTLCRKISASGALPATCNADWTKHQGAEPLSAPYRLHLLAVLLAWSEVPEAMGPDGRGLSLKCLNAALSTRDADESLQSSGSTGIDPTLLVALQAWLDQRLAGVVCEVTE